METPNRLWPAEEMLLEAVRYGKECPIDENRPSVATRENKVRADFIRFLALGGDELAPVHENGVRLIGAYIEEPLNCFGSDIRHRLSLNNCHLAGPLILRDARTGTVRLEGSHVAGIDASSVRIMGSLYLRDGFFSSRQVRLAGAKITGNLECSGGTFKGNRIEGTPGEFAIYCSRARISGTVYLRERFNADKEVRFENAVIDGNLDCTGGTFSGDLWALNCIRAKIGGTVCLNKSSSSSYNWPFVAKGKVSFRGATIGGNLESIGGEIKSEYGIALYFSLAKIRGSVFLSEFEAIGSVRFRKAEIGGELDFSNAKFFNTRPEPGARPTPFHPNMSKFDIQRTQLSEEKLLHLRRQELSVM